MYFDHGLPVGLVVHGAASEANVQVSKKHLIKKAFSLIVLECFSPSDRFGEIRVGRSREDDHAALIHLHVEENEKRSKAQI